MSGNGLAVKVNLSQVEAQVEAYRAKLLDEHWAKAGQSATPPPAPAIGPPAAPPPLKLDLGCGTAKLEGYTGVDLLDFPGVDVRCNIGADRWPWEDSSVDEVWCSHTVEHLQFNPEHPERIHFVNELWRVLKPGAKATIVVPHWASCRMYGDYTHREPVSEFWPPYLQAKWRKENAPHNPLYKCDFDCTQPGYGMIHPELAHRNDAFKNLALMFGKDVAGDMKFTLVCKK